MEYALVAVLFFWFVAGAVNAGVSFVHKKKGLDTPLMQLASQHGWSLCVYPSDDTIAVTTGFRETDISNLQVKTIACVALLGSLRDEHPDPIVADKAVDLLIALKTHTSTTVDYAR